MRTANRLLSQGDWVSQWPASVLGPACVSPWRTLSSLQPWGSGRHKRYWLSQLGVLEAHLLGGGPKSLGIRFGVQSICSSGRSLELWVPSWWWVVVLKMGFMGKLCLSLSCFDTGFFMFAQRVGVSWLVFGFLSEGIVPHVPVSLVCP